MTIATQPATMGLYRLFDSTGIKMLGEGEWQTKKHGSDCRRQWRKVHLCIEAATLESRWICWGQFQGSNSSTRLTGWSAVCVST